MSNMSKRIFRSLALVCLTVTSVRSYGPYGGYAPRDEGLRQVRRCPTCPADCPESLASPWYGTPTVYGKPVSLKSINQDFDGLSGGYSPSQALLRDTSSLYGNPYFGGSGNYINCNARSARSENASPDLTSSSVNSPDMEDSFDQAGSFGPVESRGVIPYDYPRASRASFLPEMYQSHVAFGLMPVEHPRVSRHYGNAYKDAIRDQTIEDESLGSNSPNWNGVPFSRRSVDDYENPRDKIYEDRLKAIAAPARKKVYVVYRADADQSTDDEDSLNRSQINNSIQQKLQQQIQEHQNLQQQQQLQEHQHLQQQLQLQEHQNLQQQQQLQEHQHLQQQLQLQEHQHLQQQLQLQEHQHLQQQQQQMMEAPAVEAASPMSDPQLESYVRRAIAAATLQNIKNEELYGHQQRRGIYYNEQERNKEESYNQRRPYNDELYQRFNAEDAIDRQERRKHYGTGYGRPEIVYTPTMRYNPYALPAGDNAAQSGPTQSESLPESNAQDNQRYPPGITAWKGHEFSSNVAENVEEDINQYTKEPGQSTNVYEEVRNTAREDAAKNRREHERIKSDSKQDFAATTRDTNYENISHAPINYRTHGRSADPTTTLLGRKEKDGLEDRERKITAKARGVGDKDAEALSTELNPDLMEDMEMPPIGETEVGLQLSFETSENSTPSPKN